MKGTIKKRLCCILCLLMLLQGLAACKGPNESPGGSNGGTDELPIAMVDLVKDGKTDYVIVYDNSDLIAVDTANRIWEELYQLGGVSLGMRSDKSVYEKEIVIGAANREEISALDASLSNEDDFIISYRNGKLFLYAKTAVGAKKMLLTLKNNVNASKDEKRLAVAEQLHLQGSLLSAEALAGNVLTLTSGGASDYKIIYSTSNEDNERVAYFLRAEFNRLCGADVKISTDRVKAQEKELIIGINGACDRSEFNNAKALLRGAGDFVVTVQGEKLILIASDSDSIIRGAEYIVQTFLTPSVNGVCRVSEADEYRHLIHQSRFTVTPERLSYLYADIMDRYPTLYQLYLDKTLTSKEKADQQLCEALVARMGGSAVVSPDKTIALWNGFIQKLDTQDYGATATLSGTDDVLIPADFANRYFGAGTASTALSLKTLAEQKGYTYYYDAVNRLAIISPAGIAPFSEDALSTGGYTNMQYRNRMADFFDNSAMPEPGNDTEQSRVVIEDATDYYPADALDFTQTVYTSYYSPSILTVQENGENVLYAANERSKIRNGDELSTVTMIRKSTDGGKTWELVGTVSDIRWAALIEVNGCIYGIGSKARVGLHIFRLESDGAITVKFLWSGESGMHEALIDNGILYLPLDHGVASVPIDSDIMVASNWTKTQRVSELITQAWFESTSGKKLSGNYDLAYCQEGNMLKGQDGKLYAIYRIESMPYGNYAVMLELSSDGKQLKLLPNGGSLLNLPTTVSRFTIKYDAESGYYISISNLWTVTDSRGDTCRARNVVGLSVSRDLINWTVVDTLLVDREMMNSAASCWAHAYQYVDWDFDGDDLVLVVREATGFTNTFHDGKYFTFYRVTDFRNLL